MLTSVIVRSYAVASWEDTGDFLEDMEACYGDQLAENLEFIEDYINACGPEERRRMRLCLTSGMFA